MEGCAAPIRAFLDPEPQAHFRDHFLDAISIDLSTTLFICTANNLEDISPPFWDRLQPLQLRSCTREEQITIGEIHLLPRLQARLQIDDEVRLAEGVIEAFVDRSAPSPGMRQLQGQLETVMTRGLGDYLVRETPIVAGADQALGWVGRDDVERRPIGVRMRSTDDRPSEPTEIGAEIRGYRAGV